LPGFSGLKPLPPLSIARRTDAGSRGIVQSRWRSPACRRQRVTVSRRCSAPAVSGDRVYVVTNSCEILCLDVKGQADGNGGDFKDGAKYIAGDGKPPISLDATDGDIIWKYDLIDQLGICPHDVAASATPCGTACGRRPPSAS